MGKARELDEIGGKRITAKIKEERGSDYQSQQSVRVLKHHTDFKRKGKEAKEARRKARAEQNAAEAKAKEAEAAAKAEDDEENAKKMGRRRFKQKAAGDETIKGKKKRKMKQPLNVDDEGRAKKKKIKKK